MSDRTQRKVFFEEKVEGELGIFCEACGAEWCIPAAEHPAAFAGREEKGKPWKDGYLGLLWPEEGCRVVTQIHMQISLILLFVEQPVLLCFIPDECYLFIYF